MVVFRVHPMPDFRSVPPVGTPVIPLLTAPEAQALLQCSRPSLHRYVKAGLISAIQRCPRGHRLFDRSDVEALIQKRGGGQP
jgi:hypothetical protein